MGKKKRKFKMILSGVVLLILALASIAYLSGQYAKMNLARKFPPPGKMVGSTQHRLHVNCQGQGPVTVLLEAGLNEFSVHWHRVQTLLVQHTKTCAYDRAGLGWSEINQNSSTLQNMVDDLRLVIQSINENHPLILVGHSYGSLIVRRYAQLHPENIRALVLVDPANEFMADRLTGYREAITSAASQFKSLQTMATLGLMAISSGRIPAGQLEGQALEQYRAVLATGSFFKGAYAESSSMLDNLAAMQQYGSMLKSEIPVVILSRGQSSQNVKGTENDILGQDDTWAMLQADLANRLNAKQIVAEQNDHHLQLSKPKLVYKTVLSFIES
jgi:pimeloyl-ACP methyl ester carboxylesterase